MRYGLVCEAQIGMSVDHLIAMRAPRPARGWAVLSGAPGCFSGIYFGDTLGIYMAIIGLGARQGGGAGPSWLICTSTYWS